jgi:hypothetical protein
VNRREVGKFFLILPSLIALFAPLGAFGRSDPLAASRGHNCGSLDDQSSKIGKM